MGQSQTCPYRDLLDKEYQAILAVQAVNSFDTSDVELLMEKLLSPLFSCTPTGGKCSFVFLFINHISSACKDSNKFKSTFLPSL
jgi:hypothetical protein